MENKRSTGVIIVGAGLTGLTAAWYLKSKGCDVVVLEKNSRPGGVIQTFSEDGFIYEAGPNTGVLSHPEAAELFEDLAGRCRLETADARAKRRLIWKSGRWHALPNGLLSAVKTPLFNTRDKLRILGEPFRRKGQDPFESVAGLVKRRLGKSYLDFAVDPFISGIYAGDPEKLVTRYALPKLYALEQNYGSFIRGAVRKMLETADERQKKATREVFSAGGGLASLTAALADGIGSDRILLNSENVKVKSAKSGFIADFMVDGRSCGLEAPFVVSTVDSMYVPGLFPFIDGWEISKLSSLEYAAVTQVIMGYRKWRGMSLNAFGGLVPSVERRDVLGILFPSSFLKNRAPDGGALLSVFIGGYRRRELAEADDDRIRTLVYNEVVQMLGLEHPVPDIFRIFRYPRAIPQYFRSSKERLEAIDRIEARYSGLILAGAIRDGIGMADRIRQAKAIAGRIAEKLTKL